MITADLLVKEFGGHRAVDEVSFTVHPGRVTGFLGPNGAGKSTTMRMILGLDRPSSGSVTVNGHPYRDQVWPLHQVGALLDAHAVHPGRTARNHLWSLAAANGIGRARVRQVIELTGLDSAADTRVGAFSLGMAQRLGIAAALLGDPGVVLFDEPVNGLDPDGIVWIRTLMRTLAAEGRTVLISSHLMSEMALTAEHLLVIGQGKILADAPLADLIDRYSPDQVRVQAREVLRFADVLRVAGARVQDEHDAIRVSGVTARQIGEYAAAAGVVLDQLVDVTASLEEAYFQMTDTALTYRASASIRQETV